MVQTTKVLVLAVVSYSFELPSCANVFASSLYKLCLLIKVRPFILDHSSWVQMYKARLLVIPIEYTVHLY